MSTVPDAIARYRSASEAGDLDGVASTLADDVELVSPLSGRMVFRGRDDLMVLLTAVYGSLSGWRWTEEVGDGPVRVLIGEGRLGPVRLGDAMAIELDGQGQIRRVRPHLRPWLGLTAFALVVGPKLAPRPGILLRALRG